MANTSEIYAIRFTSLDDKKITDLSFANVYSQEMQYGGKFKDGGIYDLSMGTWDSTIQCKVCKKTGFHCLGHPGHMRLKFPVIQPLFLKDVKKWLTIICSKCGRCVLSDDEIDKLPKQNIFDAVKDKVKQKANMKCHHCQESVGKISKVKDAEGIIFEVRYPETNTAVELFALNVAVILGKISDDTIIKLGRDPRSHPKNAITNNIVVTPNTTRPYNMKLGTAITHSTTMLYMSILDRNKDLRDNVGYTDIFNQFQINDKDKEIVKDITARYYALIKGKSEKSNSVSLAESYKGKTGKIRGNMLGCRVFNIGRSVISNDPTLRPDELRVPLKFAKTLQVCEVVQPWNIDKLRTFMLNGTLHYPGATMIVKKSGTRHGKYYLDPNLTVVPQLEIGDELYRDLVTGDYVNFNRQPSLKETSITAMKVVVTEDPNLNTLGFNVIATKLFNADYDGDAMNIIPAASVASRSEIELLNSVTNKIIDINSGRPSIGQVDDSIIGSFEFSRKGVSLDKFNTFLMFSNIDLYPIFEEDRIYSNKEIMNVLFEKTPITFDNATTYYQEMLAPYVDYDPDEIRLKIENGKWKTGVFDKKNIGAGAVNGIYHEVAKQFGKKAALDLIFNMQQIAIMYLRLQGFTVGINDLIISEESKAEIDKISSQIIRRSELISDRLHRGELVPPLGKTVSDFYEELQINELNVLDDFVKPVLSGIDQKNNNLFKLIMSGSKGSLENMFNMVSSIGQKKINGERIRQNYDYKRTSAYYRRYETDPESRGYIVNSYLSGLNVSEYISNAQASRFDLISKALMTSVTGHVNRKSVKNLESIIVDNFRSAKKDKNIIHQLYGENGFDARKCERVKLRTLNMSIEEIHDNFHIDHKHINEEIENIISDRDFIRANMMRIEKLHTRGSFNDSVVLPVNVAVVRRRFVNEYNRKDKVNPNEVYKQVKQFCDDLKYVYTSQRQKVKQTNVPNFFESAIFILKHSIRTELSTKILVDEGIGTELLQTILDFIWNKTINAMIEPGTAAGIIAAQAYSEPLTQYMLDAHHRSAKGGTSKSEISKVNEIFGATDAEKVQESSMNLFIIAKNEDITEEKVQELASQIELITLKDITSTVQIFHEKYGEPIHPDYKHEAEDIKKFNECNPLLKVPSDLANWRIRIVISKTQLILKSLSLEYIVKRLREKAPDVYFTYNNEQSKVIHINAFVTLKMLGNEHNLDRMISFVDELLAINIRGIEGIVTAQVKKRKITKIVNDKLEKVEEYYISTVGSNIVGCLAYAYETINNANIKQYITIDPTRIQTDNISEVENIYGIEAARMKIVNELKNIIDDLFVSYYLIYADEMTYTGEYTAIDKGGLTKRESNPLLGMAYEAPVVTLEKNINNRDLIPVTGISGPMLMGTVPKIGTMYNDLIVDPEFVKKHKKTIEDIIDAL